MNISEGIYRGFKIVIHLVPGTSGQIVVSAVTPIKEIGEILRTKIGETSIRKILDLPEKDTDDIQFFMLNEEHNNGDSGFQWMFMFNRLSGNMSKYEFLAVTFKKIDELHTIISKFRKENSENQPK